MNETALGNPSSDFPSRRATASNCEDSHFSTRSRRSDRHGTATQAQCSDSVADSGLPKVRRRAIKRRRFQESRFPGEIYQGSDMQRVFLRLLFLYLFRLKIGRCLARCNKREHMEFLSINERHFVELLLKSRSF